jgi:hypothetical protein
VAIMMAIFDRFFHRPPSGQRINLLLIQRELHVSQNREILERDEKSPYCGFALLVAVAAGVSFWVWLIWAVVRVIR